jgi:hypothetical protein
MHNFKIVNFKFTCCGSSMGVRAKLRRLQVCASVREDRGRKIHKIGHYISAEYALKFVGNTILLRSVNKLFPWHIFCLLLPYKFYIWIN